MASTLRITGRSPWLWFALVAIAYALVATRHIDLPGVYMDAVNPDYLVVKLLNPRHEPIVAWVLQGNYLLGDRVPILIALYHGSQTFWFGLPLFWLFGTTVEGLRLTHAVFGLVVLGGMFYMLRRARLAPMAAAALCIALALDPSFTYAFRTQSYITLAPLAWMLFSLGLLFDVGDNPLPRWMWSGMLAGFAVAGYFVHAFFLPVVVVAMLAFARIDRRPWRARWRWMVGLVIGASPYLLGYGLLARKMGGVDGFIRFFEQEQASLHAFASPLTPGERVEHASRMLLGVISDAWHHAMMFGEWVPVPWSTLKVTLLLVLPLVLWIAAELRRTASSELRVVALMPMSFFAVALVFGDRLGGHHFIVVVPLLYAWLGLGLRDALAPGEVVSREIALACFALFAVGIGINAAGQVSEGRRLEQTGGVGLMSDAINKLAADLNAASPKPFMYFPDWGLSLPVVFLTRGTVGTDSLEDYARAKAMLCSGRDIGVALIDDREARTQAWTRALDWDPPQVQPYRQRDGTIVFDRLTYRGRADDPRCVTRRGEPVKR
ncbi:MAG TPA: glycosyltransferase family 39 protein [Casimicrobiaceae bacterium]|nr:glycosyltransferase family 39 protein [Casimicrobiaceae bacterium]